ncbi:MAG: Yip1 family protein [Colwellia sp.]
MILNHLLGLYSHPKNESKLIKNQHESLVYSLIHILVVTLIPVICGYYATAHIGWTIGAGEPIKTSSSRAFLIAVVMYAVLVIAVLVLSYVIQSIAKKFHAETSFAQSLELAVYSATPMLMVGIVSLFPVLWLVTLAGIAAVSYSVYLLYSGVPIMIDIPDEKSFIYSGSVIFCGLVLLAGIMAFITIMWSIGFSIEHVS